MVARKRGGVINIASVVAFQPIPYWTTYAATKAFVLAFGEGLAGELRHSGVRVLTVCPGFTRTGLYDESGIPGLAGKILRHATPEEVVDAALAAWDRGRVVRVVGFINRLLAISGAITPRPLLRWLMGRLFAPGPRPPGALEAADLVGRSSVPGWIFSGHRRMLNAIVQSRGAPMKILRLVSCALSALVFSSNAAAASSLTGQWTGLLPDGLVFTPPSGSCSADVSLNLTQTGTSLSGTFSVIAQHSVNGCVVQSSLSGVEVTTGQIVPAQVSGTVGFRDAVVHHHHRHIPQWRAGLLQRHRRFRHLLGGPSDGDGR